MSAYISKACLHARRDGIEATITDEDVSVNLILSNEALWNLVEYITENAPEQYAMMVRIMQTGKGAKE